MEGLIGTIVLAAVVIGGVYGLTAWYDRRDAKYQKAIDEDQVNAEIQAAIRRRTEANAQREVNAIKKRAENQFRIDDEQWRDWN